MSRSAAVVALPGASTARCLSMSPSPGLFLPRSSCETAASRWPDEAQRCTAPPSSSGAALDGSSEEAMTPPPPATPERTPDDARLVDAGDAGPQGSADARPGAPMDAAPRPDVSLGTPCSPVPLHEGVCDTPDQVCLYGPAVHCCGDTHPAETRCVCVDGRYACADADTLCEQHGRCDVQTLATYYLGLPSAARQAGREAWLDYADLQARIHHATSAAERWTHEDHAGYRDEVADFVEEARQLADVTPLT